MEADEAKPNQAAKSDGAEAAGRQSEVPLPQPRWYQRASFWRAIAGMAIALAIGGLIAATETASDLFHRSRHYRHRIAQLDARVKQMRGEIAAAQGNLARLRDEAAARDTLGRVLAAPDARMFRLAPRPAGGHASGLVAFSRKLGLAAVEVRGLKPPPVNHGYVLWWLVAHRRIILASRLPPQSDINIGMPPIGVEVIGSLITLEPLGNATAPGSAIILWSGTDTADLAEHETS